jgi:hypothetical protein
VVVLGGALEPAWVRARNGRLALNGAAERMTVPAAAAPDEFRRKRLSGQPNIG